jgi:SAM-dependent methyltransferase
VQGEESYEGFFGEHVASVYDDDAAIFDTAVVRMLESLVGRGRALELGIGTGRIALPLAERGVRVAGIDDSEAMVARLRAKPGGDELEVAIGDFATTRVDGEFTLVYLVSSRNDSAPSTTTSPRRGSARLPSNSVTPGPPSSTSWRASRG